MFKHFIAGITGNLISLVGTALLAVSTTLMAILFVMQSMGFEGSAYLGIVTYVFLPLLFIVGIALVPLGIWVRKRRDAKAAAQGQSTDLHFPIIDFNKESTRGVALGFVMLAIPTVAVVMGLSFKAVHYMDSDKFCGTVCHTVMQPEYTAYQRSPHSRVGCAGCHIGAGAEWFVKAKVSGSWQLVAVAFDLYPTPIETPVHSLRPSSGTCEQCHTPTKFVGDRLKVRTHYADDEQNTELKTALMVKVGGRAGSDSHGIHWHIDPGVKVRYLSDAKRETIYDIELTEKDGAVKLYKAAEEAPAGSEWRTMDCIDCHNRPSHIYRDPAHELDLALLEGRIDRALPFVKREGLRLLTEAKYETHEAAREGLARDLEAFYSTNYPDLASSPAVEQAGKTLGEAYASNVFPKMKVTWNTYPNHIGHQQSPGCFRCHDNKHKTADGDKVGKKCGTCHSVVADEESDSKLLQELGLQEAPPETPPADQGAAPETAAATTT
jgi:hypothetical protein